MPVFKTIPQDKIERARELYDKTDLPLRRIAEYLGITEPTLMKRRETWGWPARDVAQAGVAEDLDLAETDGMAAPVQMARLIAGSREAFEKIVPQAKSNLARALDEHRRPIDIERHARALSAAVKSMAQLKALEASLHAESQIAESRAAGADSDRSLEELRDEFARRIAKLDDEV